MKLPARPIIYEINTAVFLTNISLKEGCPITLESVPDLVWDEIANSGFDAVWFMGVWERSTLSRELARSIDEYRTFVPDAGEENVIGSAYSIARYEVNPAFGGRTELALVRKKLASRGVGLILDFVPNHVGLDHHWTTEHPEYFITGTEEELCDNPAAFYKTPQSLILARGKDPNFPPWSDVAQLNAFSPELRQACREQLRDIANQCDGVRCDMAMLFMNDIFASVWGSRAGSRPDEEFWVSLIHSTKTHNPDFIFIAEVYWDKEEQLLEQGFDYCYDKKLYDYLIHKKPATAIKHINDTKDYQYKLVRFIANHDEQPPANILSVEQEKAAAVIVGFLSGAQLLFDGQLIGYPVRIPVQVRYGPKYEVNQALHQFYTGLLGVVAVHRPTNESWQVLKTKRRRTKRVIKHIFCWSWQSADANYCLIVNFSSKAIDINLKLSWMSDTTLQAIFGEADSMRLSGDKARLSLKSWGYVLLTQPKSERAGQL